MARMKRVLKLTNTPVVGGGGSKVKDKLVGQNQ